MSKEEIAQRIKYLVEFGGLYEDPVDDLRKQNRILFVIVGLCLVLTALHVVHLL